MTRSPCQPPVLSGRSRRSLLKPRTWRRQRFLDRPERYYAYFASLLKRPGIQLTGDITPSYSGLSAATLRPVASQPRTFRCDRCS